MHWQGSPHDARDLACTSCHSRDFRTENCYTCHKGLKSTPDKPVRDFDHGADWLRRHGVVAKGQTLCIIEAMKLMNEIEAEVEGKIAEIFVLNATPVEFGEKLFRIEPA